MYSRFCSVVSCCKWCKSTNGTKLKIAFFVMKNGSQIFTVHYLLTELV